MIKFCWKTTCLLAAGLLFGDPWNGELWNCLLLPAYTLLVLFFTFIFQPRIACSSPTANCLLWSIFQFYLFSRRVACFSRSARHWPKVRIVCFDRIIFVWETTSLTDTETFLPRKNCSIPIANACLKNWQKSQNREVSLSENVVHLVRRDKHSCLSPCLLPVAGHVDLACVLSVVFHLNFLLSCSFLKPSGCY